MRGYDPKASAPLPQPVVGPYELTSRLGRAGAGELFLARRSGIERWFALELSDEGLGPAELTRRRHEAERASRVEHPGVVRPIDIGQHHGRLYVVHEHLAGRRLCDEDPLGWREAVRVVTEVADALEAGLRAGVAHPGLEAEHVLLDARDGRARVLGLGADLGHDGARAAVLALAHLLCRAAGEPPPLGGGARLPHQLPLEIHTLCRRALEGGGPPTPGAFAAALRAAVEELDVVGSFATSLSSGGRWSGGARPVRLIAVVGAWSLSLAAAAAWGWWEHDQRVRAQHAVFDGEERLLELQGREATLLEEVARLSGALDGERERAARADADLHGARAELTRVGAAAREQEDVLRRLRGALEEALRGRDPLLTTLPNAIDHALEVLEPLAEALPVRARLLHNRGRFAECLASIEQARAAGRLTPALRLLQARTLYLMGESARANQLFAELAREPLSVPEGRYARAVLSPSTGAGAAVDLLRTTSTSEPVTATAARILLSQILQQHAIARRDVDTGQEALRVAEEAVRADPTSYQAYFERSAARYHLWVVTNSRDRAQGPLVIADLVRARALFADPMYWLWAGKSYLEMLDQPAAARVELEEARRRADLQAPDDLRATVLAFLGVVHLLEGEEESVATCWREALRIAPEAASTYAFLPYLARADPERRERVLARLPEADRARIARRTR